MAERDSNGLSLFGCVLVGGVSWWAMSWSGPLIVRQEINLITAIAAFCLIGSSFQALAYLFESLGGIVDYLGASKTSGLKGTADWIERIKEIRKDYKRRGWGPYWGVFKDKARGKIAVFSDYTSTALTVGTTGSGKSAGVVIPAILAIRNSKIITDFKGSLTVMLIKTLRARGERVRVLNFANMYIDELGPSDQYNPLCVQSDCYNRPGGLLQVGDSYREAALKLLSEPPGDTAGQNDNGYFRKGSRNLVHFAMETSILINGEGATLGEIAMLLNDKKALLKYAQWACDQLEVPPPAPDHPHSTH